MPTPGVEAAVATTVGLHRAGGRPAAVEAVPTRSGTSPGILAAHSWDRPRPAARRVGRPRRAHRSPVARVRAQDPKAPGGAEVVQARVARVAALAPRRLAVPVGRPVRLPRESRSGGGVTREPSRHKAGLGRRRPGAFAANRVSPIRAMATPGSAAGKPKGAAPVHPTPWVPSLRGAPWVVLPAAGHNRRGVPSRSPGGGRCATPTSGRPTVAAEPKTARGTVLIYG
jgi:hypothetical protein